MRARRAPHPDRSLPPAGSAAGSWDRSQQRTAAPSLEGPMCQGEELLALRVLATSGERSASEIARRNITTTAGWQTSRTTVAPKVVRVDTSISRLRGAGRSGASRIRAARFVMHA